MRRWLAALAISAGTLAVAGGAGFVLGEFYDLSATRQHPAWVYRAIAMARDTVIWFDARDLQVPPGFAPRATPDTAALYQRNCARCHGAPGLAPKDFALAMMPVPTNPVDIGRNRSPAEIYRFVSEGLKMSGMPAWQERMTDRQMWEVTALVAALPTLSPADYRGLLTEADTAPQAAPQPVADRAPDPQRGRRIMQQYACRSCHVIPGIVGKPDLHVGPPLGRAGARRYIAGVLPNRRANMVRWIMDPREVNPLTAMPDLGVPRQAAEDMAAYLYTLSSPPPPPSPAPPPSPRP